jgi:ATP-dependent Lon protease
MTGEVTLRGKVLGVGGLKEKVMAAYRAGIKTVVLPADNRKDLVEIPEPIRSKIKFVLVSAVDEVFQHAFAGVAERIAELEAKREAREAKNKARALKAKKKAPKRLNGKAPRQSRSAPRKAARGR